MPINQGKNAGGRGRKVWGNGEFLPGKLEIRGRCHIWQRPLPDMVAGAVKSVIGRCCPFFDFERQQKADNNSFAKVIIFL
jgi:hypothetical protein